LSNSCNIFATSEFFDYLREPYDYDEDSFTLFEPCVLAFFTSTAGLLFAFISRFFMPFDV